MNGGFEDHSRVGVRHRVDLANPLSASHEVLQLVLSVVSTVGGLLNSGFREAHHPLNSGALKFILKSHVRLEDDQSRGQFL